MQEATCVWELEASHPGDSPPMWPTGLAGVASAAPLAEPAQKPGSRGQTQPLVLNRGHVRAAVGMRDNSWGPAACSLQPGCPPVPSDQCPPCPLGQARWPQVQQCRRDHGESHGESHGCGPPSSLVRNGHLLSEGPRANKGKWGDPSVSFLGVLSSPPAASPLTPGAWDSHPAVPRIPYRWTGSSGLSGPQRAEQRMGWEGGWRPLVPGLRPEGSHTPLLLRADLPEHPTCVRCPGPPRPGQMTAATGLTQSDSKLIS